MARFVLVHGAFHGAWCWEPLVVELRAAGHTTQTLDLPGSGDDPTPLEAVTLDAYSRRVCEAVREQPEPAVLVGHSMGGVVITQAAARCADRIARLVYVAAFLPQDGQSLLDLTQLPEGAGDQVQANMVVEGEPPVATMPAAAAPDTFYGACTAEQAAWGTGRIGPQPVVPFVTPVQVGDALSGLSGAYVVCTRDRAIPAALQRRMAEEGGCDDVIELDTDHSPFLSATSALASALDQLATPGPAASLGL